MARGRPDPNQCDLHDTFFSVAGFCFQMPREKAQPKQCCCGRPVRRPDGLRAWAEGLCQKCWGKRLKQSRATGNLNLQSGRTPQARLLPPACCPCTVALQAAKKRWRVKGVKKGSYSSPRRVLLCKVTHHVGSSIHVPSLRGGRTARGATATVALCQMQARNLLQGTDVRDTWLLFVGSVNPDPKYKREFMHDSPSWKAHVSGHCLATCKVDKLLEPAAAKKTFGRNRRDTGRDASCALAQVSA